MSHKLLEILRRWIKKKSYSFNVSRRSISTSTDIAGCLCIASIPDSGVLKGDSLIGRPLVIHHSLAASLLLIDDGAHLNAANFSIVVFAGTPEEGCTDSWLVTKPWYLIKESSSCRVSFSAVFLLQERDEGFVITGFLNTGFGFWFVLRLTAEDPSLDLFLDAVGIDGGALCSSLARAGLMIREFEDFDRFLGAASLFFRGSSSIICISSFSSLSSYLHTGVNGMERPFTVWDRSLFLFWITPSWPSTPSKSNRLISLRSLCHRVSCGRTVRLGLQLIGVKAGLLAFKLCTFLAWISARKEYYERSHTGNQYDVCVSLPTAFYRCLPYCRPRLCTSGSCPPWLMSTAWQTWICSTHI